MLDPEPPPSELPDVDVDEYHNQLLRRRVRIDNYKHYALATFGTISVVLGIAFYAGLMVSDHNDHVNCHQRGGVMVHDTCVRAERIPLP